MTCQITRSHYQNALTATRMDSSPQTPDADTRLTEGNTLIPEPPTTEHGATLMPPQHTTTTLMPPPREQGRPSSARTRGQQSSVPHSTSLLNEKNRIVRKYPRLQRHVVISPNIESQRANEDPAACLQFRPTVNKILCEPTNKSCSLKLVLSGSIFRTNRV